MASLRYSLQADADMRNISASTVATWSERRAVGYLRQLEDCCQLIANNLQIGRACENLSPGLRRLESGMHSVFYVVESDGVVLIARVIHQGILPESDDFVDVDW